MLASLIRKLSLSALLICALAFFILWMDSYQNSGGFIKGIAEMILSRKGMKVSIAQIESNYLSCCFKAKGITVRFQDSACVNIDSTTCFISLGLFHLNLDINATEVNVALFGNLICYEKIHSLCSFDFINSKYHVLLEEEKNKKLAEIKIEPGKIVASVNKGESENEVYIAGTLISILDKKTNLYQIYSQGSANGIKLDTAKLGNFYSSFQGTLHLCSWEFNYVNEGRLDFLKLQDLKLRTEIADCKLGDNVLPKALISTNVDQKKILSTFSFEGFKGKTYEVCLDRRNGKIEGSGILHGSIAPILEKCLPRNLKNVVTNVAFSSPLKWDCALDYKNKDFACNILTRSGSALVKIKKHKELIQNVNIAISMSRSKLCLKISGIAQNFGAHFECNSSTNKEGFHEANINFVMLKTFKIDTFAVESGRGVINLKIKKWDDFCNLLSVKCDLTNLAFFYEKLGFEKCIGQKAFLTLHGQISECRGFINVNLIGEDNLGIDGLCIFEDDGIFLNLDEVCYGDSSYSFRTNITERQVNTEIIGEVLDLHQANLLAWVKPDFCDKNLTLSVNLDFIFMKNAKIINQVKVNSSYNGSHYTESIFQGGLDGDTFVNLMLQSFNARNVDEDWVFTTNNTGAVVNALGLYDGMNFGALKINFVTDRSEISQNNLDPFTSGKLSIGKFRLRDSPHPLVSLLCPSSLVRPFVNKHYTVFDSLTARFYVDKGVINVEKAYAKSISHDCFIREARVSPDGAFMKLRGEIAPSWYGMGNVVRSIPILGGVVDSIRFPGFWIPYRINVVF